MRERRIRTRRARREEGAVLMVVMLILLAATALAGIALQATAYELRAAGFGRSAVQTQYVSEAAMVTTLSWVDSTSLDGSLISRHVASWVAAPPSQSQFGEPELTLANSADASRTTWEQQSGLTNVTLPPITVPGAAGDVVGTFGPRLNLHPGNEDPDEVNPLVSDYVVDMYDCRRLSGIGSPGAQVNQVGSGTIKDMQLFCVITSRGRSYVPGGTLRKWQAPSGVDYEVNRLMLAHDSRGTVVSPPIVIR